jgi:myo-inositol catabolism protein IolS
VKEAEALEIDRSTYRELKGAGVMVSPIMLGTYEFDGQVFKNSRDAEAVAIIRAAIDRGVNFFDTAEGYGGGHSEEVLGEAVRQSGKDVVIASKIITWGRALDYDDIRASVENSLRRLKRDRIDLYMLHWPTRKVSMKKAVEAMAKLRDEGKIGAVGVSNFSVEEMEFARGGGAVAALQSPYSLVWRCLERDILPYCLQNGISVLPYSPLGAGMLTGLFTRDNKPAELTAHQATYFLYREPYYSLCMGVVDALLEIGRERGCRPAQAALAWLLGKPAVTSVLIGVEKEEQLFENLGALRIPLTREETLRLEAAGEDMRNAIDATMAKSMSGWWPDK